MATERKVETLSDLNDFVNETIAIEQGRIPWEKQCRECVEILRRAVVILSEGGLADDVTAIHHNEKHSWWDFLGGDRYKPSTQVSLEDVRRVMKEVPGLEELPAEQWGDSSDTTIRLRLRMAKNEEE